MQAPPSKFESYSAGELTPSGETQFTYDATQGSAMVSLNYTDSADGLLSATIYARQFEDDVLAYEC